MEDILDQFQTVYENRSNRLKKWKEKNNKKIFGYFCSYVPEEIIHAADILPVRVLSGTENITKGTKYLASFNCPYVRACFDQVLKKRYHYLDGIVQSHTCEAMGKLFSLWSRKVEIPESYYLSQPYLSNEKAEILFVKALKRFASSLEALTLTHITTDKLNQSIRIYNENRRLLSQIYEFRKSGTPLLSGSEVYRIVRAGMLMSKEKHNAMLRELLEEFRRKKTPYPENNGEKMRVMVSGGMVEDVKILEMIESSGGQIVTDDLCMGTRYFTDLIEGSEPEPFKSVAQRYLNRTPCACKLGREKRWRHIKKQIDEYGVEGVVFLIQRNCQPHLGDYPYIRNKLNNIGLPYLLLNLEHGQTDKSRLRTRIETFVKSLGGNDEF